MDPRPTNYLRQNIVFSYSEMTRVSFSLFLSLSVFCYVTLLLIFMKIILLLLLLFFSLKLVLFFHVPGYSGIFRNVPECSMFRLLSTPQGQCDFLLAIKADIHEGICSRSMLQAHFACVSTHERAFSSSLNLLRELAPKYLTG